MNKKSMLLVYKRCLKADAVQEYESAHAAIPPKVVEIYRDCGVSDIRLYRTGLDLVMVVILDPGVDTETAAAKAMQHDVMVEWVNRMEDMFEGGSEWTELKQIFRFPPV